MQLRFTDTRKNAKRFRRALCACVALVALTGYAQRASAEFFQFGTTVSILTPVMPPGSTIVGVNPSVSPGIHTPDNVTITLIGQASNSPGDNLDATGFGSDIVFGSISVAGVTNVPIPSTLETISIPYVFHISVNDFTTATGAFADDSATFDISGIVSGTVGPGKRVNLSTNTYSPGNVLTKVIGGEHYTLSLNTYVPPGPTNPGFFGAHVTARIVPEPGTITLLGFGALALAIPAYRRWQRKV